MAQPQQHSFALTKNDSADIGFALSCLNFGAINFQEFKDWLIHVITHSEEVPHYVFDMLDVDNRVDFKPYHIMGWVPSDGLSDAEQDALTAIALDRGIITQSDTPARPCPKIAAKCAAFFPFVDFNAPKLNARSR